MVSLMTEKLHALATNYVGIASYVVLVYDYLLTFSDEVELIWRKKKSLATHLFFLNRYFFIFAFIPNLIAYLSPWFRSNLCSHFVRYEGAQAVIGIGIAGLMMGLRVNALYAGYRPVKFVLIFLWLFQVVVFCVFLTTGTPVPRSMNTWGGGCSMIFSPEKFRLGTAALTAAAPVLFDSVIVALTVYKCMGALRRSGGLINSPSTLLSKHLLEDGLMYYIVVFTANLSLAIMIVIAPPGLKNISSQFSQLITATMLSRITLHLRAIGERRRSSLVLGLNSQNNTNMQWRAQATTSVFTTGAMDLVTCARNSEFEESVSAAGPSSLSSETVTIPSAIPIIQAEMEEREPDSTSPGSTGSVKLEQGQAMATQEDGKEKEVDRCWRDSDSTLTDDVSRRMTFSAPSNKCWDQASSIESGRILEIDNNSGESHQDFRISQSEPDGIDIEAASAIRGDVSEEGPSNAFARALDVLQNSSLVAPNNKNIEVSVEVQVDTVHR